MSFSFSISDGIAIIQSTVSIILAGQRYFAAQVDTYKIKEQLQQLHSINQEIKALRPRNGTSRATDRLQEITAEWDEALCQHDSMLKPYIEAFEAGRQPRVQTRWNHFKALSCRIKWVFVGRKLAAEFQSDVASIICLQLISFQLKEQHAPEQRQQLQQQLELTTQANDLSDRSPWTCSTLTNTSPTGILTSPHAA